MSSCWKFATTTLEFFFHLFPGWVIDDTVKKSSMWGIFIVELCSTLQHCDPGVFRSHHHHQPHHHHLFWPHRGWWHFIMTIFHRVYNFAVLFKGRGPFRHAHLWTLIVVECNMEYVCTMHTCEFVDIRCKILIWKLKDVVPHVVLK